MKLFKNIEISRIYGVNPTTVTNWIEASLLGKNNLILENKDDRKLIVDNQQNRIILEQLTQTGKKHKSKDSYILIEPKPKFYQTFDGKNLVKLINSLENNREIPHNFTYLNGGADCWRAYAERTFRENMVNTITNTLDMLETSMAYLLKNIQQGYKVNIIDIGVGDASPVKNFLAQLIELQLINKYIAIDFSPEMLEIAEENVKNWFGEKINFEKYVADISSDSIQDILFYSSKSLTNKNKIINLVLFIGSTIENQMDYFKTLSNLKDNLSGDDILFLGETLDSNNSKIYFDLNATNQELEQKIPFQEKWIPELLNLDEKLYDTIVFYSETDKTRKMQLILNSDIDLVLKKDDFVTKITLQKGEKITVWRHKHHSTEEIIKNLSSLGLTVKNFTTSEDLAQALIVCSIS